MDAGIVWCMNHEKSVHSSVADRNDDDINETAPTQTFDRWSQSQIDMQSLIATNVSNLKTQRYKYTLDLRSSFAYCHIPSLA